MKKRDAGEELEYLENEINNLLNKGLEQFLEKYSNRRERVFIYIQMWTPAWNDGEACVHSVDWCMGAQILDYEYYKNEKEMFDGIEEREIFNSEILDIKERDIQGVIKHLEKRYTTNTQCLIILGDKERIVSITKEYDCGY
jgi:hypothetical protein